MRSWTGSPDRGLIDFKAAVSRVKRVEIQVAHTQHTRERRGSVRRSANAVPRVKTIFEQKDTIFFSQVLFSLPSP